MTDDLIERLRFTEEHGIFTAHENGMQAMPGEAADRIEELTTEAAENARIIGMSAEREMALRGEVERLRTALRFYAAWGVFAPSHDDAVILDSGGAARAALEGTSHDD